MLQQTSSIRVGVVVTCYNKAQFIAETIESVVRQTYPYVQLVVVDDGSTDGSRDRLAAAVAGTGATVVDIENGGVSAARNHGASLVDDGTAYLLFLDGDDVLEPTAIERMVEELESCAAAVLVYSIPTLIDEEGLDLGPDPDQKRWVPTMFGRLEIPFDTPGTPLESIWSRFRALPSGSLIRRSAFDRTEGWDSSLCRPSKPFHAEDKDMAIQLALLGDVHRLPESLFRYRVLPTPHRQSIYEGLWALNVKWWNKQQSRSQQKRVRRAIRFDSRVTALDAWEEWRRCLSHEGSHTASAATVQAMLSTMRWIAAPLRLRRAG